MFLIYILKDDLLSPFYLINISILLYLLYLLSYLNSQDERQKVRESEVLFQKLMASELPFVTTSLCKIFKSD